MYGVSEDEFDRITRKLAEFMQYCQKVQPSDSYLIVNRNSPVLSKAAEEAAHKHKLNVQTFDLTAKTPYKHFPKELITLLCEQTPKAGIGLFDYSLNLEWNLEEVGARIELLHGTIEKVPISWAHSPGITLDMALNGPIQCDYKKMAKDAQKLLQKLRSINRIHITAPGGTDLEIEVPSEIVFDTDCVIVPPNVYGEPGKFGNLPIGEVWSQKGKIIPVHNKESGRTEKQNYPVKHPANGRLVCDIAVGGYPGRINPKKPLIATFKDGILKELQCSDPALNSILEDIASAESKYDLPTVLEEVGIGLNNKARNTGNMLEDEKLQGTCHIAPGNIRCHVDMLVDKPTIIGHCVEGAARDIMRNGNLV